MSEADFSMVYTSNKSPLLISDITNVCIPFQACLRTLCMMFLRLFPSRNLLPLREFIVVKMFSLETLKWVYHQLSLDQPPHALSGKFPWDPMAASLKLGGILQYLSILISTAREIPKKILLSSRTCRCFFYEYLLCANFCSEWSMDISSSIGSPDRWSDTSR